MMCKVDAVFFNGITAKGFDEVKIENERFTVVSPRCRRNLNTLLFSHSCFCRIRQGNVLTCVLHVQHDYLSPFRLIEYLYFGVPIAGAVVFA